MKMFSTGYFGKIKVVEVERSTESSVWIKGRRHPRVASYECYFDTFAQAKEHLIAKSQAEINCAKRELDRRRSEYSQIQSMKPPKEE